MTEEVRRLFRVKGRTPDVHSHEPASANVVHRRNIFQHCISYRRSSSSSPPSPPACELSNDHHHHHQPAPHLPPHHHAHIAKRYPVNDRCSSASNVECRNYRQTSNYCDTSTSESKQLESMEPDSRRPALPPRPATAACSTSSSHPACVPPPPPPSASTVGPSDARPNSVPPPSSSLASSLTTHQSICKPRANEPRKDRNTEQNNTVTGGNASSASAAGETHNLTVNKTSSSCHKLSTRSPSPMSPLEQLQSGVDTLDVCDKAATRLRELAAHLEHGDIPNSVLKKTLQYAAFVLDTVSMDETRKRKASQILKKVPKNVSSQLTKATGSATKRKEDVEPCPAPWITPAVSCSASACSQSAAITCVATNVAQFCPKPNVPKVLASQPEEDKKQEDSVKRAILTQVDPKEADHNHKDEDEQEEELESQDSSHRRLLDEEDELAEVQPDTVPSEVRQWLASTFTRTQVPQRPRNDEKPKFRSVANAIRAGIMVDKIYRRLLTPSSIEIPSDVSSFLKGADEWCFDIFTLNTLCPGKVLRNLSTVLLNRYGLVHKFKIPSSCLESFLNQIELGYQHYSNPYHNNLHAADVTQTVHYLLWVTGLTQWLTDLEIFATLIAAIIHDFKHTGTTNSFHIMSQSEISLLYNDRSVLENFHVSEAFQVMRKDESNITINLSKEEFREFRTLIIEMVIATDMSSHFQQIKTLKTLLSHQEFAVDKQKGLSYILHSADISHPSKTFALHQRWTLWLIEEFFRQGDREKELGLPYSPLCDRNSTLVPQSQIGFIDFIVAPTMELCGDLIERVHGFLNGQQPGSEGNGDEQVVELSDDQARSQSSIDTNTRSNGSSSNLFDRNLSAPAYRCSAPVILFKKLNRPWLKHLEENKNLWQQKASEEAKLMEADEPDQANNGKE